MDADLCEDHDETASLDEGGAGEESAIQGDALESHVSNYELTHTKRRVIDEASDHSQGFGAKSAKGKSLRRGRRDEPSSGA